MESIDRNWLLEDIYYCKGCMTIEDWVHDDDEIFFFFFGFPVIVSMVHMACRKQRMQGAAPRRI